LDELYGVRNAIVIPELIDLNRWHNLLQQVGPSPDEGHFTVLSGAR
jgi:hypothetical protein